MQNGDELQLLSGLDTNKKGQEAEIKRRASALGETRIRDEDIIGTAVHAKCWEIKPERLDSDGLDGEYQGRRMLRSEVAGKRPGGGAERRFMDVAREDVTPVGV